MFDRLQAATRRDNTRARKGAYMPKDSHIVPAPLSEPLTEEELFDLKCIRIRNMALASEGCGASNCDLATCLIARHARVTLKAIAALVPLPLSAPPSGRVRTHA